MVFRFLLKISGLIRKKASLILAIFWCGGILSGILLACSMGPVVLAKFPSAVCMEPTVWTAVWASCVPVLLSALALHFSEPWLLLVCYFQALRFGFASCGLRMTFDHSSWLIQLLFLFPDYVLIPWLYLLWLRLLAGQRHFRKDLVVHFLFAITIGLVHYRFVAPFLSRLVLSK